MTMEQSEKIELLNNIMKNNSIEIIDETIKSIVKDGSLDNLLDELYGIEQFMLYLNYVEYDEIKKLVNE